MTNVCPKIFKWIMDDGQHILLLSNNTDESKERLILLKKVVDGITYTKYELRWSYIFKYGWIQRLISGYLAG